MAKPLTVEERIAHLRKEIDEAKRNNEFEQAFLLLDKLQELEPNETDGETR